MVIQGSDILCISCSEMGPINLSQIYNKNSPYPSNPFTSIFRCMMPFKRNCEKSLARRQNPLSWGSLLDELGCISEHNSVLLDRSQGELAMRSGQGWRDKIPSLMDEDWAKR